MENDEQCRQFEDGRVDLAISQPPCATYFDFSTSAILSCSKMEIGWASGHACKTHLWRFVKQRADCFEEFRKIERLFHQRAGSCGQSRENLIRTGRDDYDRHQRIVGGNSFKSVPAIFEREIQIKQDQIDVGRGRQVESIAAVAGGQHEVTLIFENAPEHLAHAWIIVDEENFCFHAPVKLLLSQIVARLPWSSELL